MRADYDLSAWFVVLVDDDPDNLTPLSRVLQAAGAEVRMARNGIDGLAAIEDRLPTLVLLDLSMPMMDGWEALRRIRANPRTSDLIVIAITAHAMTLDRIRALNAGFDGYLTKPFRPSEAVDILVRCVDPLPPLANQGQG